MQSKVKPIILDGAVGNLLESMDTNIENKLLDDFIWTTKYNSKTPDKVIKIHESYIESGADMISTNTFRTNPIALSKSKGNLQSETEVQIALDLAKKAKSKSNRRILIAGCNPPAEDCWNTKRSISKADLLTNHHSHIDLLLKNGADVILNETMSHLDEIVIVCDYCESKGIPFILSIYFTEEFQLLSGERVLDVMRHLKSLRLKNLLCLSFNCIDLKSLKALLSEIARDFLEEEPFRIGFYLNNYDNSLNEDSLDYLIRSTKWLNPYLIGGCCYTRPKEISIMRKLVDKYY